LCVSQAYLEDHTCDHDQIEQNPEFLDVQEDTSAAEDGEGRKLASYSNMRIHVYYGFLKSSTPSSYASYVQNDLVPPMVSYVQSALRIKYPVVGDLKLGSSVSKICEQYTPSILKTGVAADMFTYFDTDAYSGTQIAKSKYCYLASGTKRPLVTRVIINRNMMKIANGDPVKHEQNMMTILHEFIHTLGFSTYNYKYFLDTNGKTRSGHIKSVSIGGSTRTVLDLPPLTSRLRSHFGCSTLPGAVMENGGGDATASSHFERKFFVYEAMTSGSIIGRRISEFSLALLEGSGWYIPNYEYADPYFFGKGQGCTFVTGTCSASKFDEYCTGSSRGCAPTGRGGGYCQSDSLSDGCRYHSPNQDFDCEDPNSDDSARLPSLQVFGRGVGSRCFSGTLNSKSSTSATSFCFKYTCSGSGSSTKLEVSVGSTKVACTQEGTKTVSGYYGSINCPDPQTFCEGPGKKYCPRNCMGRGTCVNGTCECRSGYKGTDCALRA
jgi:hypothetical protein